MSWYISKVKVILRPVISSITRRGAALDHLYRCWHQEEQNGNNRGFLEEDYVTDYVTIFDTVCAEVAIDSVKTVYHYDGDDSDDDLHWKKRKSGKKNEKTDDGAVMGKVVNGYGYGCDYDCCSQ
jgi:hypothetical protein